MEKKVHKEKTWYRVKVPTAWRPTKPGEELVGEYIGTEVKAGRFGEYQWVQLPPDPICYDADSRALLREIGTMTGETGNRAVGGFGRRGGEACNSY